MGPKKGIVMPVPTRLFANDKHIIGSFCPQQKWIRVARNANATDAASKTWTTLPVKGISMFAYNAGFGVLLLSLLLKKRTKNEGSPVYLVIVVDAVSHGAGFQLRNHNPSDVLDLILASHFVPTGKKWMKIAML
jgi:hypothetical protein